MSEAHRKLWEILNHKVDTLLTLERREEATTLARQALAAAERAFGAGHPQVVRSIKRLGDIYTRMELPEDARFEYERALKIASFGVAADYQNLVQILVDMAGNSETLGRPEEAVMYYEEATSILERAGALNTLFAASVLNNLAYFYRRTGREDRGEEHYRRALKIFERLGTARLEEREQKSAILSNLGALRTRAADYPAAERLYLEALELRVSLYGPVHPETAHVHASLATVYHALGAIQDAATHYEKALAIFGSHLASHHEEYQTLAESFRALLKSSGKRWRAMTVADQARKARRYWQATQKPTKK